MGDDLVVGVGLVEILAVAQFQDHGLGLVHERGLVRHFEIFLLRQLCELLIGFGVVVDHLLGKLLHILRCAFFQRHLGCLDFRDAFGRGFIDEVVAFRSQSHVGCQPDEQGESA